jgi:hypothetical protein
MLVNNEREKEHEEQNPKVPNNSRNSRFVQMLEKIRVKRPKLLTHSSFSQPRMSFMLAVCLSLDSTTGYGVAADIF